MATVSQNVAKTLTKMVMDGQPFDTMTDLNNGLRLLAKWRSIVIANTYIAHHGAVIFQGPFEGMTYVGESSEGALAARLLGTYESELHPHLAQMAEERLDCIIDIGCAEGYYAVGLARMIPDVMVHAYDTDPAARNSCREMAEKNGVADRVVIGERFDPADFQAFEGRRCLVMVDTEGAEVDILDPELGPALAGMYLIVETHSGIRPGALATMLERFTPTHEIEQVDAALKSAALPDWFRNLAPLDHLLATWEWRTSPTPWLVMRPKAQGQS